ncbi:sirohydrochlorin chelatase [Roseateles sp.]|jgi:sirohydrochlorin cobaltochelatase|uniref:sirohydrochlorin chelatase n=1 Tax=Roseateles sp. TaxID=1971397 RepID=UPI0037C70D60
MDGMLLFAHGARDPAWASPFKELAARLALSRPAMPMALAFLELMEPGIETAADSLVAQGCRRIHIVPLFLGASGHVRRDIPPLIERLRERHGDGIEWLLHPAIGEQDGVINAMAAASLAMAEAAGAKAP